MAIYNDLEGTGFIFKELFNLIVLPLNKYVGSGEGYTIGFNGNGVFVNEII